MKNIFFKIIKSGKIAPLLSGLLIVLAFPPLPLGFLAWVGLLPLLASYYYDDFHLAFEKSFIYGFVLNLGVLYWLSVNQGAQWYYSALSMVSSILFLALFYGIAGSIVGFIGRKGNKYLGVLSFPFVFTGLEWLRSLGSMGFTWNNLCYTQSSYESILQMTSFTGPFGLSLWIYLLNILLFGVIIKWRECQLRIKSILFIIFIFPFIFGSLILFSTRNSGDNTQMMTVTVVQPNTDPNKKWEIESYRENMDKLFTLSQQEIDVHGSDMLIWPETAVPTYIRLNRRNSRKEIMAFIKDNSVSLITGVPDYEFDRKTDDYHYYNSLYYMQPDKEDFEVYRKMHLVPFGEYIPLSHQFEELKKLNLGQANFESGEEITVFNLKKNDYSIAMTSAICFESGFANLIRKGIKKGSQMIAIISNDAWFGNTSAPYLHAEIARFRAVENHVPVVRAANTGISMIINKYGQVLKKSAFNEEKALTTEIDITKEQTFYSQTGNWIGVLCVILMSILIILSIFRRNNEN